jgi:hypothetical protein
MERPIKPTAPINTPSEENANLITQIPWDSLTDRHARALPEQERILLRLQRPKHEHQIIPIPNVKGAPRVQLPELLLRNAEKQTRHTENRNERVPEAALCVYA